jgi:hypothetical protein
MLTNPITRLDSSFRTVKQIVEPRVGKVISDCVFKVHSSVIPETTQSTCWPETMMLLSHAETIGAQSSMQSTSAFFGGSLFIVRIMTNSIAKSTIIVTAPKTIEHIMKAFVAPDKHENELKFSVQRKQLAT